MTRSSPACPLCRADDSVCFATVRSLEYRRCRSCDLVFLLPVFYPDPVAEKARYLEHNNDPEDVGYRAFLSRLADPLSARLAPEAEGLDYGCGPEPALAKILEERGFRMAVYDPYFAPDPEALKRTYDFLTCTETAEHFFSPGREFARLDGLLRPGGWLGVMTTMLVSRDRFDNWWYRRDPTHVCFYTPETMGWIARRFGWARVSPRENVTLFHKPERAGEEGVQWKR